MALFNRRLQRMATERAQVDEIVNYLSYICETLEHKTMLLEKQIAEMKERENNNGT